MPAPIKPRRTVRNQLPDFYETVATAPLAFTSNELESDASATAELVGATATAATAAPAEVSREAGRSLVRTLALYALFLAISAGLGIAFGRLVLSGSVAELATAPGTVVTVSGLPAEAEAAPASAATTYQRQLQMSRDLAALQAAPGQTLQATGAGAQLMPSASATALQGSIGTQAIR